MSEAFKTFFERSPALLFSLFALFGALFSFGTHSALLPALFLLFVIKRRIACISLCLLVFSISKIFYVIPPETVIGKGVIQITGERAAKNNRGWVYRAVITDFFSKEQVVAKKIPCSIYSPLKRETDFVYQVSGTLKKTQGAFYTMRVKNDWEPLKKKPNLVDLRNFCKKWFQDYLSNHISQEKAAGFLGGLSTGVLDDPILLKQFERRGLTHLLAISGFHFAMIAICFHFIFRIFLPSKLNALLLIVLLSSYFLFIGFAPSVQRAWLVAIVALIGLLVEKRPSGINSLGLALFVGVLLDPLTVLNAGFQLSFLAAAGILFLFKPLEKGLQILIPKSGFLNFMRENLALGIAVHLAIIPHLLFLFHKMPWHGLLYNLYFPFLVTISLILVIVATLMHMVLPPLGLLLHQLNGFYTQMALDMLELPLIPHKTWYVGQFPAYLLTIYLTLLFGGAIYLNEYFRKRRFEDPRLDFHFI